MRRESGPWTGHGLNLLCLHRGDLIMLKRKIAIRSMRDYLNRNAIGFSSRLIAEKSRFRLKSAHFRRSIAHFIGSKMSKLYNAGAQRNMRQQVNENVSKSQAAHEMLLAWLNDEINTEQYIQEVKELCDLENDYLQSPEYTEARHLSKNPESEK